MAFVDKVKKNGIEYEIHDTEGRVKIDGTSLIIPEQSAPEPVGEFDGVKYYHKCEFDLTKFTQENLNDFYDILTGEVFDAPIEHAYIQIGSYGPNYPVGSAVAILQSGSTRFSFAIYVIAQGTSVPASVNYTSRAFTVVDTVEEVTDNTKILLPTCSAYYGFLSEDGKTFISYYNLKTDGTFEFIDSVKQGDNVIPIGRTGLYMHKLYVDMGSARENITVIAESSAQITKSDLYQNSGSNVAALGIVSMFCQPSANIRSCFFVIDGHGPGYALVSLAICTLSNSNGTIVFGELNTLSREDSTVTDTVTPL